MKINIFGDVMLGRNLTCSLENGVDLLYEIRSVIDNTCYNICNLESPIILIQSANKSKLYASEKVIPTLKFFKGVTLANNHIFDQGLEGLYNTISILDEHNIKHTGIGKTKEKAFEPIIMNEDNKRVMILGITSKNNFLISEHKYLNHIALIEDSEFIDDFIKKHRETADLLIVLPHMGVEHVDAPNGFIVSAYRNLINAGFDMVIGSHPHTVQGMEIYNNGIICYSLGDFIFDNINKLRKNSLIVKLDISENKVINSSYILTSKCSDFKPYLLCYENTKKYLKRTNKYIGNNFAYKCRFLICKSYNQGYLIYNEIRLNGMKGLFSVLEQKINLIFKR